MEMLRRSGSTVAAAFFVLTILSTVWTTEIGSVPERIFEWNLPLK